MLTIGQRADQPAALGLRQRRVGRLADQRVAEQRDLAAPLLTSLSSPCSRHEARTLPLTASPQRGSSCCQAARRPTARGDHATDRPARTAAATLAPRPRSLPTRPRNARPPAPPRPSSGSSATAHRVKCARIAPRAREPPQPAAHRVRGHPQPPPRSADAPPRRRSPHRRADHRDLVPPAQQHNIRQQHVRARAPPAPRPPRPQHRRPTARTRRSRACPHGPSTPPHDGQPSPPPTSSASTSACSAHTINTGCHLRHPREPSRRNRQVRREGSRAFTNARSLPTPPTPCRPSTARASRPAAARRRCRSSTARDHAHMPNFSCAQHRARAVPFAWPQHPEGDASSCRSSLNAEARRRRRSPLLAGERRSALVWDWRRRSRIRHRCSTYE